MMNREKVAAELVKLAKLLTPDGRTAAQPRRYFTLDEKKKWILFDQGLPVNAPNTFKVVQSLADRYGWEIDQVWLAAKGKFVSLEDAKKIARVGKELTRQPKLARELAADSEKDAKKIQGGFFDTTAGLIHNHIEKTIRKYFGGGAKVRDLGINGGKSKLLVEKDDRNYLITIDPRF